MDSIHKQENMQDQIRQIIANWISCADISQKELAEKLGIAPPSFSTMLSGKIALPISRFLQIIYFLHPEQSEIDCVWELYLKELNIPKTALRLVTNTGASQIDDRKRVHELVDQLPDIQLLALKTLLEGMVKENE